MSAAPGLTPEAMAPHRTAWADLAARALEPSIFNDPAFALPAALHLPGGGRSRFLAAWDPHAPARLIGLCPVAASWFGLPLSAWLHPQATAAFPMLDRDRPAEALAALLGQAAAPLRPAGLMMHGLPSEGATMRLLRDRSTWALAPVAERSRAVLREPPPPLGGKAGKEFRRQARRLAEQGRVVAMVEPVTPAATEAFLTLEAAGWKGRRATALAAAPGRAAFTRAMMAALASEGRCRVHSLTLDGRPIAMGLVLRSGPHAFFWKTTFDEACARFSPGAHLAAAMAAAPEPSLALTDSCAVPGHSMIDRLWPERMSVVDVLVSPTTGLSLAQRAAVRIERAGRRVRARLKEVASRAATMRP